MSRNRRKIPSFFSFEIGEVRGISESMDYMAWGKWSKKALNDLSIGCTRKDTDPRVKEFYENAKSSMDSEYERKKKWYEANKAEKEQGAGADNSSKVENSAQAGSHNAGKVLAPISEPLWGEFQNVKITQGQFNELAQYAGNVELCKTIINALSRKLEDGTTKSLNHFATLKNWIDADKRRNSSGKSFKQIDKDNRTEFFKKSVVGEILGQEGRI